MVARAPRRKAEPIQAEGITTDAITTAALTTESEGSFTFPTAETVGAQKAAAEFQMPHFANWAAPMTEAPEAPENELSDTELEAAAAQADEQANADQAAFATLPNGKLWRRYSDGSIIKPTKRVWAIADAMMEVAEKKGKFAPSRKEVQDFCVELGIASGTARTQYQHWFKENVNWVGKINSAARLKLEAPESAEAEQTEGESEPLEIEDESEE